MSTESEQLLILNAIVHSLDTGDSTHEAIVIENDIIRFVGSNEQASRFAPGAHILDLNHKVEIFPGFVDAHAHVINMGASIENPRLDGAKSIDEFLDRIGSLTKNNSRVWIRARGWDQNLWQNQLFPTAEDLSRISDHQPIALTRVDGHALWCNDKALEIAGISRLTPDPAGGLILRDPAGNPTGILVDEAMKLVEGVIPPDGPEQIESKLRAGLAAFAENGHVAVHEMGISRDQWNAYVNVYQTAGTSLPTSWVFLNMLDLSAKALFLERAKGSKLDFETPENLHFAGIKLYLDGALGSRGANLFEPYADDPGNTGLALGDDEEVVELMKIAARHKLQIAVHAIGDAANSRALDLFEKSGAAGSGAELRIEHAQIVRKEDIQHFAKMGVHAVVQPAFFSSDRHWAIERLGPARMQHAYRWKSLAAAGVNVVASSDAPIEYPDPLFGIDLLITRNGVQDGESLSRGAAWRAYSQNVCKITGESNLRGVIAPGYKADLTFVGIADSSSKSVILGTMREGRWIYSSNKLRQDSLLSILQKENAAPQRH